MATVSKFEAVNLPNVPKGNRESVQSFIEGIDYLQMLRSIRSGSDARALSRATQSRFGVQVLQLSYARSFEGAAEMARIHYRAENLFRSILRKPKRTPDSILNEGSHAAKAVAAAAGRGEAFNAAQEKTKLVVAAELAKKREFPKEIAMPLIASAAFLCGLKVLEDLNFPRQELYMANGIQRWAFIEQGFGIYLFDNAVPYLLAAMENGNNGSLDEESSGGGEASIGKA
jgi:hypothetical protein